MKKLLTATMMTVAIVLPALAQTRNAREERKTEIPAQPPAPQMSAEKLNFLVFAALENPRDNANGDNERTQHFSIVTNAEKVSALAGGEAELPADTAAIIVSVPKNGSGASPNPYFAAGIAVQKMTEAARRVGLHVSRPLPAETIGTGENASLGIPETHTAVAAVLVNELPPRRHPAPGRDAERRENFPRDTPGDFGRPVPPAPVHGMHGAPCHGPHRTGWHHPDFDRSFRHGRHAPGRAGFAPDAPAPYRLPPPENGGRRQAFRETVEERTSGYITVVE